MKKDDLYHSQEQEGRKAELHEPAALYQAKAQVAGDYPIITQRELDENCMTLDEFIQGLQDMVHTHFHP